MHKPFKTGADKNAPKFVWRTHKFPITCIQILKCTAHLTSEILLQFWFPQK